MGPFTLFDKSFLQSLSVDESVWFDHFFVPVVCPLFFVETLADLAKEMKEGSLRTAEDEVRIVADKTPVLSGMPCVHHGELCVGSLMGTFAPHPGQIPMAGGRPVRNPEGKPGVVFKNSPEAEAFARWQRGQFLEVERGAAADWRRMLSELDLQAVGRGMQALGITPQNCKTIEEAHGIASSLVHTEAAPEQQLRLMFTFVDVPGRFQRAIHERWREAGFPPLAQFAPYAAHVLKVELFFQIALAAKLIAAERASNRADIAYLFYLPFCNVFVSADKLHRRCVQPFLRKDQDFAWGPDLKADLSRINVELSGASEAERLQGLHKFAPRPPGDVGNLVPSLWHRHGFELQKPEEQETAVPPEAHDKLLAHLRGFQEAATAPEVAEMPSDDLESLSIERLVPPKKGSWWLIPKHVADEERRQGRTVE
ncbi:hypothetical protein [Roseateles sp. BYS96W]|uniref:Uncharacterized protein n=1 Tax=Pelomonas nitida TaxID=3299027 RepID=A0ABW7GBT9_9BURK